MPWDGPDLTGRYGKAHRRLRAWWKVRVDRGGVCCARCGLLIERGARWELDHHDTIPELYLGPSHRWCNRQAGNIKGGLATKARREGQPPRWQSQRW